MVTTLFWFWIRIRFAITTSDKRVRRPPSMTRVQSLYVDGQIVHIGRLGWVGFLAVRRRTAFIEFFRSSSEDQALPGWESLEEKKNPSSRISIQMTIRLTIYIYDPKFKNLNLLHDIQINTINAIYALMNSPRTTSIIRVK